MHLSVAAEEFVDGLLSKEAKDQPSDNVKPDEFVMELPEWYDEEKFERGRRFYHEFSFSLSTSMLFGLVAVLAVPSILRVLIGTRRSNSLYTAYKRYVSTYLHTMTWFEHELKPGTTSWRSLHSVRNRHLRASLASEAKGNGMVSQRDIALTQFGFIGFSLVKPDKFSIRQLREGDWDAYTHFWRVIGHMIGLEDKYNICRETAEETIEVCQLLVERVFTPCLENVPEYFEHMARVMLDGLWCVNPTVNIDAAIYWCRHLADVPGYIYTENERMEFQKKLKKLSNGKLLDSGVDSSLLISKPSLAGLPDRPPQIHYYNDYSSLETTPAYKQLNLKAKIKLFLVNLYMTLYSSYLGRLYFNLNFQFSLYLMRYFPYLAFFRFGVKASFVNIFADSPTDNTRPKTNAEYYKPEKPLTWYQILLSIIW